MVRRGPANHGIDTAQAEADALAARYRDAIARVPEADREMFDEMGWPSMSIKDIEHLESLNYEPDNGPQAGEPYYQAGVGWIEPDQLDEISYEQRDPYWGF